MIELLIEEFQGQHVYLFTEDETVPFYRQLGFKPQGGGAAKVIREWLKSPRHNAQHSAYYRVSTYHNQERCP